MSKRKTPDAPPDLEGFVGQALAKVIEALGLRCTAEVRPRGLGARDPLHLVLTPDETDNLGPRRWTQVAQAVGALVEAALIDQGFGEIPVGVFLPEPPPGAPRPGREAEGLEQAARALAEAAAARGRAFALGPMAVGDRRLVHQALGDVPGVWTQSAGEGIFRRLWVIPREALADSLHAAHALTSSGSPNDE